MSALIPAAGTCMVRYHHTPDNDIDITLSLGSLFGTIKYHIYLKTFNFPPFFRGIPVAAANATAVYL
jgi:hypothetical protein